MCSYCIVHIVASTSRQLPLQLALLSSACRGAYRRQVPAKNRCSLLQRRWPRVTVNHTVNIVAVTQSRPPRPLTRLSSLPVRSLVCNNRPTAGRQRAARHFVSGRDCADDRATISLRMMRRKSYTLIVCAWRDCFTPHNDNYSCNSSVRYR